MLLAPIPGYSGYVATSEGYIVSFWHRVSGGHKRGSTCAIGDDGVPLRDFDRGHRNGGPSGYRTVCVKQDDGRMRNRYVHELVLLAFVGPRPSADHEALHGDANRANNRIDNLRWGTVQENADDRERHGHVPRGDDWYRARGLPPPSVRNEPVDWQPPEEIGGPFDDLLGIAQEAVT